MASTLSANQTLTPGQELLSNNGLSKFVFQGDGNLVLYVQRGGDWIAHWASNTDGQTADRLIMQGDGNLVIYNANTPVWASDTPINQAASLTIQDDENVVIYTQEGRAIWSTDTWVGQAKRCSFTPETHGFKFINNFEDAKWLFITTRGLCGGMCYSALDYYHYNYPIPHIDFTPPSYNDILGTYIYNRQTDSLTGSWHLAKFIELNMNPDDNALKYWATHDEWQKLTTSIDQNIPIPIGLVLYMNASSSHQVVACGYQDDAKGKTIICYDPNNPGGETFYRLESKQNLWIREDDARFKFRGYFVESAYVRKNPMQTYWSHENKGTIKTFDNDIIDFKIDRGVVNINTIKIILELGPKVTWWKALNVPNGQGNSSDLICENNTRKSTISILAKNIQNIKTLTFKKAKEFGRKETNIQGFKLHDLDGLTPGSRVTFKWVQD